MSHFNFTTMNSLPASITSSFLLRHIVWTGTKWLSFWSTSADATVIVLKSTDGTTWTETANAPTITGEVAVDGAGKVMVIKPGATTNFSLSSDHGETWTAKTGVTGSYNVIAYGGGVWAVGNSSTAVTSNHFAYSSNDGSSWTRVSLFYNAQGKSTYQMIWDGSRFVAALGSGTGGPICAWSTNGASWTQSAAEIDTNWLGGMKRLAFNGTTYVALTGGDGVTTIFTSTDRDTWTQRSCGYSYTFLGQNSALVWNGHVFIVCLANTNYLQPHYAISATGTSGWQTVLPTYVGSTTNYFSSIGSGVYVVGTPTATGADAVLFNSSASYAATHYFADYSLVETQDYTDSTTTLDVMLPPTMEDIVDALTMSDTPANQVSSNPNLTDTGALATGAASSYGITSGLSATAAAAVTFAPETVTMLVEALGLDDGLAPMMNTKSSLADSASMQDMLQQVILNAITDTANGVDAVQSESVAMLVDLVQLMSVYASSYSAGMIVAELVVAVEYLNTAALEDIMDAGVISDVATQRIIALAALLDSAQGADEATAVVYVMQNASDTGAASDVGTSEGSVLGALLADSAVAYVRLNIGGELFTGWVLNADSLAASEYQFADLNFNSACKHGDRYLMAADDGIYEFTEAAGAETVMTYLKTGKTDFGSDLKKRIVNSYIAYSATGQMVLKVTTSEYGNLVTRDYRMVPNGSTDTTDVRRVDIGKGVTSRYWQFEVLGDGVDCDIDEIGVLPVVLSRRL